MAISQIITETMQYKFQSLAGQYIFLAEDGSRRMVLSYFLVVMWEQFSTQVLKGCYKILQHNKIQMNEIKESPTITLKYHNIEQNQQPFCWNLFTSVLKSFCAQKILQFITTSYHHLGYPKMLLQGA